MIVFNHKIKLKTITGINKIIPVMFLIITLYSCSDNFQYYNSYNIENTEWQAGDIKSFDVEIKKPNAKYEVLVDITNSKDYKTSNLWLFVSVTSPKGVVQTDTVMFLLTDQAGHWYGKESEESVDNRFLYKSNISFPIEGKYIFTLQQGMREQDTPLIEKLGLRIEELK